MNPSPAVSLPLLQQLEQQLLHTDFTASPAQLEAMLADDFAEVSPLGRSSTRAQVLEWLLHKDPLHRWHFSAWQFTTLAPAAALLRYHAVQSVPPSQSKGALHVSLWCFNSERHCWQLRYHQSSKVT